MTTAVDGRTNRRITTFRPTRDDLVDGGFLLVLGALALVGFRTTYSGSNYLIVGITGLVIGIVIAHVANIFRQPMIVIAVMAVAVFFLLGTALALRSQSGVLPTLQSTRDLADVSVHGWKQLLTTLPPVESNGPLLVIPYILGLIGGVGGFAMARRLRSVFLPLFAPLGMLVAVVLLGTAEPAAKFLQGAVFAMIAFVWVSVRGLRLRPPVQNGIGRRSRVLTAVALIGATLVIAAVVGPGLPAGSDDRVVLRSYVEPPFDINAYPSPLVGYRKYTKPANNLWDQTLFVVKGLPEGDYIRIATLDGYDGAVWTASNTSSTGSGQEMDSFQRVGTTIANDASGEVATLSIKIGPAYAASNDVNAWLPSAGSASEVRFVGRRGDSHAELFVYNRAIDQGIVPDRLQAGDAYTVRTVVGVADKADAAAPDNAALPYGPPTLNSSSASFTAAQATKWSAGVEGTMPRVLAVAKHLVDEGAFSDGGGEQSLYLPGHSLFRLSTNFLNDKQPVGDDEQYAAAFALLTNQLGVPARVVVGAVPQRDGIVQGRDIHTWVEVHLSDGQWHSIPRSVFMPPVTKAPDKQLPDVVHNANAAVVPPPNPVRPHSALDQAAQDDALSHVANRAANGGGGLAIPGIIIVAARWLGIPAAIAAVICAVIVGLKSRRRNRRRRTGAPSTRVAQGWNEIVDHARDFGAALPAGGTRRDEARHLEEFPVVNLAHEADATVFGPDDPSDERVQVFWSQIDEVRRTMSHGATRWHRWRAAVSLRSFLPRQAPGSSPAR